MGNSCFALKLVHFPVSLLVDLCPGNHLNLLGCIEHVKAIATDIFPQTALILEKKKNLDNFPEFVKARFSRHIDCI